MQKRLKANRYKTGGDDDGAADAQVTTAPCCVLVLNKLAIDLEEMKPSEKAEFRAQLANKTKVVGTLRAVGLQVAESCSRDNDEWFLKVSASEPVLKYEAEQMGLKLRVKKAHGGGLYAFQRRLNNPHDGGDLYDKCTEGDYFSSLHQLQIIERIIKANREDGGAELNLDDMEEAEELAENGFFYLHYEPSRRHLVNNWARAWTYSQPIEQIREYFGEKVALYFTWIGFYTTMLWYPALVGVLLTASQLYTSTITGSLDNPWVPLYCIFTALWAVTFLEGWKRLEAQRRLEWDTTDFEEEEADRPDFEANYTRVNRITGEEEKYYPKVRRQLKIAVTSVVVLAFIAAVIFVVCGIMVFKQMSLKLWGPQVGAAIGGISLAVTIMIFNEIYGMVIDTLTEWENWRTETEYEDAKIAKDFCFKFVNAYFALFFVAFVQNNMKVFGHDLHCPEYHCMPVLTMTLATVFATQIFVGQAMEIGMPMLKSYLRKREEEANLRKMGKTLVPPKPEEEQAKLDEYDGVFDDYNEMVMQFGYVTLFAAAFPLTATLALLNNVVEIRIDALKMVVATRRAKYAGAADIGTWMHILELLATVAIMTNVCLVGFTSHGLYFYFPDMDSYERVWIVVIAEHVLLFVKSLVEAVIPDVSAEVEEDHEVSQWKLNQAITGIKQFSTIDNQADALDSDSD